MDEQLPIKENQHNRLNCQTNLTNHQKHFVINNLALKLPTLGRANNIAS
jgi:hypothetical protein